MNQRVPGPYDRNAMQKRLLPPKYMPAYVDNAGNYVLIAHKQFAASTLKEADAIALKYDPQTKLLGLKYIEEIIEVPAGGVRNRPGKLMTGAIRGVTKGPVNLAIYKGPLFDEAVAGDYEFDRLWVEHRQQDAEIRRKLEARDPKAIEKMLRARFAPNPSFENGVLSTYDAAAPAPEVDPRLTAPRFGQQQPTQKPKPSTFGKPKY